LCLDIKDTEKLDFRKLKIWRELYYVNSLTIELCNIQHTQSSLSYSILNMRYIKIIPLILFAATLCQRSYTQTNS